MTSANESSYINEHSADLCFNIMQVVSVFGTGFNLLGLYIILCKTPRKMREYSRFLAIYQLLSTLADTFLSSLLTPYFIFPVPGGIPVGLLYRLGISTEIQIIFGFALVGHMISSMVVLFIVRQQSIFPYGHPLKFRHEVITVIYALYNLAPYIHLVPMLVILHANNTMESTRKIYVQQYPTLKKIIEMDRFYAYTSAQGKVVAANVALWLIVGIASVLFATCSCLYVIHKRRKELSKKTQSMQKKWLTTLYVQILVPLVVVVVPIGFGIYVVIFDCLWLTFLCPWLVFLISTHGIFSTVVTMAIYRPYYHYITRTCWNFLALLFPNTFERTSVLVEATTTVATNHPRSFRTPVTTISRYNDAIGQLTARQA